MAEADFVLSRAGGLRIAYEHRRGPLSAIVLGVRSGSRFDGANPGIAHLLEHMLFQGTASLDHAALNRRAAELGGEHEGSTGYEDMNLTFQVRNGDVGAAIELLAEQTLRSTIPEDRLENERNVVAQEIRGHRDDDLGYLADETWERFFADGIAKSPSGTLASVRRITARQMRKFRAERLVTSNMVLAVVGGARLEDVERHVARAFRDAPHGKAVVGRGARVERTGELRLRRSGISQLYLNTLIQIDPSARSLVGVGLALEILGTDPDGRLFHEIRERQGLSYDLWADLQGGAGWATLILGAVAARRAETKLRNAFDRVLSEAADHGFTEEEVARARGKLAYRHARLWEAKLDRATSHAASVLYGAPTLSEGERLVRSLTHAEIEAAWRRAWRGPRLTGLLSG